MKPLDNLENNSMINTIEDEVVHNIFQKVVTKKYRTLGTEVTIT